MSHERAISVADPACIVFLVDRSASMAEPLSGDESVTKSHGVADAVNRILLELVLKSVQDHAQGPQPVFDIGVIGYGRTVGSALPDALAGRELVSIVELTHNSLDAGQPRWIEPVADGPTPLAAAIHHAGRVVAAWADAHPRSFPPIVINITDGAPTDEDPGVWVQRLTALGTDDGNVLLFNLNVSRFRDQPVMFCARDDALPNPYAKTLFGWSSVLPPTMFDAAARFRPLEEGARGFGYNGDFNAVVEFLTVGTSPDRRVGS